jgi:hypothetical protein
MKPPYEFDQKELKYFDQALTKQTAIDTPVNGTSVYPFQNFTNFTYEQKLYLVFHYFQRKCKQMIFPTCFIINLNYVSYLFIHFAFDL